MRNGFSKTAFLAFASIIGFGILGTIVLAIVTAKPVGILVTGGLIFGLLTVGLMVILGEKNFELNDDFKLTIVRVKKYTLPEGVTEDEIFLEEGEEEFIEEFIEEK